MNIKDFEKKEWFIVGLSILVAILFGCLVFRPGSCGPQDDTETDCNKNATYLWKIQTPKGGQTRGYLFGLKDIPASLTVDSLSSVEHAAFLISDEVYMKLPDESAASFVFNCVMLPPGLTSDINLPPALIRRLDSYFSWIAKKTSTEVLDWRKFHPSYVVAALPLNLYDLLALKYDKDDTSLGDYIEKVARKMGKVIGDVETTYENCEDFTFPHEMVVKLMQIELDMLEEFRQKIDTNNYDRREIINELDNLLETSPKDYICKTVEESVSPAIPDIHDEEALLDYKFDKMYYNQYILKRNYQMADTIAQIIGKDDKLKFFAVDVQHYLGSKSVVELLQRKGYIVTRLMASDSTYDVVKDKK